jgi:hypothetical protein
MVNARDSSVKEFMAHTRLSGLLVIIGNAIDDVAVVVR